ncbi:glucosylglycerol-phosphate synthase [Arenimonas fontis]|uniref:Glucosylglycerol-phosphate synthase n=1 Tax=Arenimonas fontis TaxID=2608255 RepID=A0A5B2ZAX3_9GAMM|nr:glucosylglycerol-phosphate synthase [Arenimonas fontis]
MVLATDLDGTFLAGSDGARMRLYRLVARHPEITLVWVTGRGLEAVMPLLADPTLPQPDYVICDVGATVVEGGSLLPVEPLQSAIAQRWPGEQRVAETMARFPGLVRQEVPQERRCSYFCAEDAVTPGIAAAAAELGCEVLYSAARYLDILPAGVSKGSTLENLVAHLGMRREHVLVAGDTLNDLSMYEHGFLGVCVGESEPSLLERTAELGNVLHADGRGCEGILEAIGHFGFLRPDDPHLEPERAPRRGRADLVMVYHRLPYEEVLVDGKPQRRRPTSPNGIIPTLLSFFGDGREGSWVAWSVHEARQGKFEPHTTVDPDRYPNLLAARVPLSKTEVDIFYKRFSKEAFWPMLHTFWERARFREEDWKVFLAVNRKFAEAAAAEAAEGATVWIHDYNLWMVPAALRELRPDLRIAFFHHTYFPSADVFNVVPWRREILGSLLACDYIGFHIPRQVENFVDVVRGAMPVEVMEKVACAPRFLTYGCAVGLDSMSTCIETGGRRVHLGAHPVGLDVGRIRGLLADERGRERIEALKAGLGGRQLVLSVERLDYTKGILEKLQAFERLLEESPELHDRLTLITICVPAAREMTVYRQLQTQIEQAVGRINGRFSRVGWTPVQFFFRPVPFEELVAYYAAADVMWITPLRDGLNLVAKEYAAVQGITRGYGRLVLSEFAGAAAELKGALLTNPHDPADLLAVIRRAIDLPRSEARARLRQMFEIVRHHDVQRWGREFLEAVDAAAGDAQRKASTSAAVSATTRPAPQRTSTGTAGARERATAAS